jgi:hypothetical protein
MSRNSILLLFSIALPLIAWVATYVTAVDAAYQRELERVAQPFDPALDLWEPTEQGTFYGKWEAWAADKFQKTTQPAAAPESADANDPLDVLIGADRGGAPVP